MNIRHAREALIVCGLLLGTAAGAEDDWITAPESFICRSSTEVREIKTYVGAALPGGPLRAGCRVDYIRNGETRTLWSSASTPGFCAGKAKSLAAKLESSHFGCQALHPEGAGKE